MKRRSRFGEITGHVGVKYAFADPDFSGKSDPDLECKHVPRSNMLAITHYFRDSGVDRTAIASLDRLPCTRIEAKLLKEEIGGSVLEGPDARESKLRNPEILRKMANAEIVAFATHGLVSGDLGLGEPGLALAAPLPDESSDDGVLTASEISKLKLKADWVLLSACNTASPDAIDAEGLSGLSRAFFFAGARGVLVSHWRVNDGATSALVSRMVKLRNAGAGKAQAVQQATLDMLNGRIGSSDENSKNLAAHPSIWAPFTIMGDPR